MYTNTIQNLSPLNCDYMLSNCVKYLRKQKKTFSKQMEINSTILFLNINVLYFGNNKKHSVCYRIFR